MVRTAKRLVWNSGMAIEDCKTNFTVLSTFLRKIPSDGKCLIHVIAVSDSQSFIHLRKKLIT